MLHSYVEIDSFDNLLPSLRGKVFHVTPSSCLSAIEAAKAILPNPSNKVFPFGYESKAYFRSRDCVSLFDYRECETQEWEENHIILLPTQPLERFASIAVLFIAESEYSKLLSWKEWERDKKKLSWMVVPHVEAGYQGSLHINHVMNVLHVSLSEKGKFLRHNHIQARFGSSALPHKS